MGAACRLVRNGSWTQPRSMSSTRFIRSAALATVGRRCELVEFFVVALLPRQRPDLVGGRHYAIHGCAPSPLTLRCVYRRVQDLLPTVDRRWL
jgi:hypothetical protein